MIGLTTSLIRPFPGPCAAVRFEDPAVYGAGAVSFPHSTEAERLDRIARAGPAALASHELLTLFGVRFDAPGLAAAGGLRGLCDDPGDAMRERRLPREDPLRVQALLEVHARWMESRLHRDGCLGSPGDTRRYAEARLRGFRAEVFAAFFLDNRHRVITFEPLFHGTVDGASVHPREVVRRVLVHNAAAVVFAHNHPSGAAEPSSLDHAITGRLEQALATVDVRRPRAAGAGRTARPAPRPRTVSGPAPPRVRNGARQVPYSAHALLQHRRAVAPGFHRRTEQRTPNRNGNDPAG